MHILNLKNHQLLLEDLLNPEKMVEFTEETKPSPEMIVLLLMRTICILCTPFAYWLAGDLFFKGSSLGKATFSQRAVSMRDGGSPNLFSALLRSFVKGMSALALITPFALLGGVVFLTCLLNPGRRGLHDLLAGTITVEEANPSVAKEP